MLSVFSAQPLLRAIPRLCRAFFRFISFQKFCVLQFRWKSVPWCVSSCRGLSICIWNKLRKNKPKAESTPIFWQLLPRRALSLWIQERTRPDARGAARDKTLSEHKGTMFRAAATGPEGGILLNGRGLSPFWLDIKMISEFCEHGISSCVSLVSSNSSWVFRNSEKYYFQASECGHRFLIWTERALRLWNLKWS